MSDEDIYQDYSEETQSDKLDDIHSTLQEIREILPHLKTTVDMWGPFWLFIVFLLISSWPGSAVDKWTDKIWYSIRYDAQYGYITVLKRPGDCDFIHAPMGNKGCEYEKKTEVYGKADQDKLLQQATTAEERQYILNRPYSVTVYWEKKED